MPIEPWSSVRDEIATILADPDRLVRAIGSGHRRQQRPDPERVNFRPIQLKAGARLQVVGREGRDVETKNVEYGAGAGQADEVVAGYLDEPYGNWHIETIDSTIQVRITKKGDAQVYRSASSRRDILPKGHDLIKDRLVSPDDPIFSVLNAGADKRRQVDAFVRSLAALSPEPSSPQGPLRMVDLGCGNAYLTFGAHRWLSDRFDGRVETIGVEFQEAMVERSAERAARAELSGLHFVAGTIADFQLFDGSSPDVVLALHACDTATDDSLAQAIRWKSRYILAAPCCHHDLQRQMAATTSPFPYGALTRHAILRERFGDVLTDSLRALILRMHGYRVQVVEFIDSKHTPRNALIRAVYTGAPPAPDTIAEYEELCAQWRVTPALAERVADLSDQGDAPATVHTQ